MKKLLTLALVIGFGLVASAAFADDPPGEKGKGKPGGGKGKKGQIANPEEIFKKLDANGDGKLSKEEFEKAEMIQRMKEKRPDAGDRMFKRLDANGDSFLSLEEFKKIGELRGGGKGKKGEPTPPPSGKPDEKKDGDKKDPEKKDGDK
jgi:hypothetical protein